MDYPGGTRVDGPRSGTTPYAIRTQLEKYILYCTIINYINTYLR